MSQIEANQPHDANDPGQMTSLQWDWAERASIKLEALPRRVSAAFGVQRARIVGLVGIFAMVVLASALVVKPMSQMPFGAPKLHTPETARHYVKGSRLSKLNSVKRAGTAKYLLTYLTGYFLPYFFSGKLKHPDLLMMLVRSLLFGVLLLLSVHLVFAREDDDEAESPGDA